MKLRKMHPWSCTEKEDLGHNFWPWCGCKMTADNKEIKRRSSPSLAFSVRSCKSNWTSRKAQRLVARPHYFMFHSGITFQEVWKLKRQDFVTDLTAELQLFLPNVTLKKRGNQETAMTLLNDCVMKLLIYIFDTRLISSLCESSLK